MKVKLALSPAPAYRLPSGPKMMVPTLWLENCSHQPPLAVESSSTCSG